MQKKLYLKMKISVNILIMKVFYSIGMYCFIS